MRSRSKDGVYRPKPWLWKFESLQQKVEEYSIPEPNSGCLLWLLSLAAGGYVCTSWRGRYGRLQRFLWEEVRGPIPVGLHVLHHCDVRSCGNIDHYFLGTNAENVADKMKKGRHRVPCGERHGKTTLSEDQVRDIRADPRSCKIVGPEYGVHADTCYNIRNRKTWKHVV